MGVSDKLVEYKTYFMYFIIVCITTVISYAIQANDSRSSVGNYLKQTVIVYFFIIIYSYHIKRKNQKIFGITITERFLILMGLCIGLLLFVSIRSSSLDNESCPDNCNYDEDKKKCVYTTTKELCRSNVTGYYNTGQAYILYICMAAILVIFYEIRKSTSGDNKVAAYVAVSMSIIFFIFFGILNVLLSSGGEPNKQFSNNKEASLDRASIILKGGLIRNPFTIFFPEKSHVLYKGDKKDVKIKSGDKGTPDDIMCSIKPIGEIEDETKLWNCDDDNLNRIEPKCAGDWWITSNKGCLTDHFTELYRLIYILSTLVLLGTAIYSLKYNSNMYTLNSFKPVLLTLGLILGYHIFYLIFNLIVSWTFGEAFMFQDFISELIKSGDGYWVSNINCENEIETNYAQKSEEDKINMDKTHKSIWDNESTSQKVKLLINVVLCIVVVGFIGNIIGNKIIIKYIPGSLEGASKKLFFISATILSVLTLLQVIYWFISTVLIDTCVIERISNNSHKLTSEYLGFCRDKTSTSVGCDKKETKKDCIEDDNCEYDNSYTLPELIRCQLDTHGGLLFHIILVFIPIFSLTLYNTSILELLK